MSTVKMSRGKFQQVREEQGGEGGAPNCYTPEQLQKWDVAREGNEGNWVAARPMQLRGFFLRRRLKLAWGVFTGRYDALRWPL